MQIENKYSLPPGPKAPRLWQQIAIITNPAKLFEQSRQEFGKKFTLRLIAQPNRVVVSAPQDLNQVFKDTAKDLVSGEINAVLLKTILGEKSILNIDGASHMADRKILLTYFRKEEVGKYSATIADIILKKLNTWHTGDNLTLLNETKDIAIDVILGVIFGIDEDYNNYRKLKVSLIYLLHVVTDGVSIFTLINPVLHRDLWFLTPWRKITQTLKTVDDLLFAEISKRKTQDLSKRSDILSSLLQHKNHDGTGISEQQIRDDLLTLLIAGYDTTSTACTWVLYEILTRDEVLNKLLTELDTVLENDNDISNNLNKLLYLNAVIKESLRHSTVAPFTVSKTKKPYKLGEYNLPANTVISECIYLAHNDPDNWDNPDEFRPERFLEGEEKPYTYYPFGGGIRRCIGAHFAMYEITNIVAHILRYTTLQLKPNYKAIPKRVGVIMVPSGGVPVSVVKS